MTTTRRAVASTAVAALLLLAGCGSDGGSDYAASTTTKAPASDATTTTAATAETTVTDTTEAVTDTTAAEPAATTTTESSEGRDTETSVLDTLDPDGAHYGYLAGLEDGTVEGQAVQVIIWDEVQFLTGAEAAAAATAAGDESPPPNDSYIVNENQTVRRLAVVPDAQVTTLSGGSPDPVPSSVSEVALSGADILYKIEVGTVRGVTTVSGIEGVYLP